MGFTDAECLSEAVSFTIDHSKPQAPGHKTLADVLASGRKAQGPENLHKKIRDGFHAAFPIDEHPSVTKARAKESLAHYNSFMNERGGYKGNDAALMKGNSKMKTNTPIAGGNAKTEKSDTAGYQTLGMNLAPHTTAGLKGYNACPTSSSDCRNDCLGLTASHNKNHERNLKAKVLRTHYMAEHPEHFARVMSSEIHALTRSAKKNGTRSAFRFNVQSDVALEHAMPHHFFTKVHPDTTFYDYTKGLNRLKNPNLPANYKLIGSSTGPNHPESNDKGIAHALKNGHHVAVVYERGSKTPTHMKDMTSGMLHPIADGDKDDLAFNRHSDPNVIEHKRKFGITGNIGIASALKLKGVSKSPRFAAKVNDDGHIEFNHPPSHPDHWSKSKG